MDIMRAGPATTAPLLAPALDPRIYLATMAILPGHPIIATVTAARYNPQWQALAAALTMYHFPSPPPSMLFPEHHWMDYQDALKEEIQPILLPQLTPALAVPQAPSTSPPALDCHGQPIQNLDIMSTLRNANNTIWKKPNTTSLTKRVRPMNRILDKRRCPVFRILNTARGPVNEQPIALNNTPNRKLEKRPVNLVLRLVGHHSRKSRLQRQKRWPNKGCLPANRIAIVPIMSLIPVMTTTEKKPNNCHEKTLQAVTAINKNAMTMHHCTALKGNKHVRCILPVSMNRRTSTVSAAHHQN
uniref:Uncharacterized protein n=1 Tax=Romanomermis culicivorax TaxID=13658 RepID=A0A915I469_ROMCU